MGEGVILSRLIEFETRWGEVWFSYIDVLDNDPGLSFPLAVLLTAGLVDIDDQNETISLTPEGRRYAVQWWGSKLKINRRELVDLTLQRIGA